MGCTDFALGNEWATLRNGLKSTGRSKRVAKGDTFWKKGDTFEGWGLFAGRTDFLERQGLGVEKHDGLVKETRHPERCLVSGSFPSPQGQKKK